MARIQEVFINLLTVDYVVDKTVKTFRYNIDLFWIFSHFRYILIGLHYNRHFRILKMIATSGFLASVECTKFIFGRGSAPDPAG